MRVAVRTSERQLVVDLEELGNPKSLPAGDDTLHDVDTRLVGKAPNATALLKVSMR